MVIFYDDKNKEYAIGHWFYLDNGWQRFNEIKRFDNYEDATIELRFINGGNI